MKEIEVNQDNYDIIKIIERELNSTEDKAANFLLEVGLHNILTYPCGNKKVDEILSDKKYEKLIERIKFIWQP